MALVKLRRPENVEGDFYVDDSCIDCDLCRQIAPASFSRVGEQSAVYRQPDTGEQELAALKALVTCPTASIGVVGNHSAAAATAAFPEQVEAEVYFCGFAAESSFGASSYLILRSEGNVLVDSPRFSRPLARRIRSLGGVRTVFLTHRDDVADHALWAREFGAERVIHREDAVMNAEQIITGSAPVALAPDLLAIPTPGHTHGHTVLLYRHRYLFAGDHLRWSDDRQALVASRDVCWYSWPEHVRSMELLLPHDFEWVLPGHGRRAHASAPAMKARLRDCIRSMKSAR